MGRCRNVDHNSLHCGYIRRKVIHLGFFLFPLTPYGSRGPNFTHNMKSRIHTEVKDNFVLASHTHPCAIRQGKKRNNSQMANVYSLHFDFLSVTLGDTLQLVLLLDGVRV